MTEFGSLPSKRHFERVPFSFRSGKHPTVATLQATKKIVFNKNNDHNEQFKLSKISLYANLLLRVK